jgi:hypothetical protein
MKAMENRNYEIVRLESGDFTVIVSEDNIVKQMKRFASSSEAKAWIQLQKEGWDMDPSPLLELSRAARFDRSRQIHAAH